MEKPKAGSECQGRGEEVGTGKGRWRISDVDKIFTALSQMFFPHCGGIADTVTVPCF